MNPFPNLKHFSRFERITAIQRAPRGILAQLEGEFLREFLRIEVLGGEILRLKISRGGRFDEAPTFAVCADL